ncbi:MAG: BsuBI/PstI family type II restriction endonuclease [Acidobacteriaceae bacterium]
MDTGGLLESVDFYRLDANRKLDPERRSGLGQFMTPPATAGFMASLFGKTVPEVRLLDAGAGVGSLTAAFVHEMCGREEKPTSIRATVYEIDPIMVDYLRDTLRQCERACEEVGVKFESELIQADFIDEGVKSLRQEVFGTVSQYTHAILNPPYKKINQDSETRLMLREVGIETSNVYTGFLSVVMKLLVPGGEMVAITPRSFCNGPYFRPFRELLLKTLSLRRMHVFESRQVAFSEDEVLQENIIFHGVKDSGAKSNVTISSSTGPEDDYHTVREIPYDQLVQANDPESFIHIVPDEIGASVADHMRSLHTALKELQLSVSTGRVVDFRATELLRENPEANTVPLIYPKNFEGGYIVWPKPGKKPQAMALLPGADFLLVPKGVYVLVKRFSSKEEDRRVVAAVYDPARIDAERVGFENHTNYYHRNGAGLPLEMAKGLTAFLNSTLVDMYFRQFNGHTQVNATDLKSFRYPTANQLEALGQRIDEKFPDQHTLDRLVEEEIFNLAPETGSAPVATKRKIDEASSILRDLGIPREQQNERSALTFLALLDLKPDTPWAEARDPLMGIRPMMDYFRDHYGKVYAENTRESVRRFTIHQFLDAGIVVQNPDDPNRPTNSQKNVYQIEAGLLKLLRTYGTPEWEKGLKTHLASIETLKTKYAQEREMKRIPIEVAPGKTITLSPGGQNVLVEKIIEDFCGYFVSGGKLLYVGDTDEKWAYFDEQALTDLGVKIESHGKMPDVVVHHTAKNWLVLIEAVTSHGPVNPKRHGELKKLFKGSKAGLVFVTTFLDRKAMNKYLGDISWETEVWVAEAPTHLIHFNGERFLGPYEE